MELPFAKEFVNNKNPREWTIIMVIINIEFLPLTNAHNYYRESETVT